MKKSVEITKKSLTFILLLAVFIAAFSFATALAETKIANAQGDNFVRLFPTSNYFQSANPTLVSANDNYLIIYDKDAKTLFVRPNDASDTYIYSVDFENVTHLFILTDVAFLQADGKYFTIDLTDKSAVATERTLPSPQKITSLASDGNYLYAYNRAGYISVYDSKLAVAFDIDNILSDEISSDIVIAGENEFFYGFTYTIGNPFITIFDLKTKQHTSKPLTVYAQKAFVGDVIYALDGNVAAQQNHIVGIDKNSGEKLFDSDITTENFFAHRNKLFTIENNCVVVYTLSSDKSTLTRTTSITMTGNDAFHLDRPTDLCVSDKGISVVDSGNKRIAHIDKYGVMTEQVFEETPIAIANSERDIYCAFQNRVAKINDVTVSKTYDVENVTDIAYLDKLYVLAKDGVYAAIGNSLIKIFDIENAKRITVAKDGANVYLLTDTSVISIDRNGKKLALLADDDFQEAIDLAIDYQGKAYVVFEDKITTITGDDIQNVYPTSASMKATLTSACLDGENLVFTAKESFVGSMNLNATTKQNFSPAQPQPTISAYYFATANDDALNYSADGRIENISAASGDTYLVLDSVIEGDETENYRYAYVGKKLVKIIKSDFNRVETTLLSGDYVALQDTTLYSLPYLESSSAPLKEGEIVTRISDTAGYDNSQWTIVQKDEKTYFVKSSDIEEYTVIVPEKDKVYGKANADRIGGLVNVYASPDKNSQLVTQIVDGSKVEVLEVLDAFYLVRFDDFVGYVEKEHIKIDGLTTVQIVAIVLAIIVALAGSAIFASIYLTRKNGNKEKKDSVTKRI